jgi:HPt (histidine-containing phosphotransfer) domain-containing protein
VVNVVNESFTKWGDAPIGNLAPAPAAKKFGKILTWIGFLEDSGAREGQAGSHLESLHMHKSTLGTAAKPAEKSTCFENGDAAPVSCATDASTAVIDLVHLSRQTMGDSVLETELLTLFQAQALQFAARLRDPKKPGEHKWRGDLAHTLKGSARAIGAFKLGQAADGYERAVRAGLNAEAEWRSLAAAIDEIRASIANLIDNNR